MRERSSGWGSVNSEYALLEAWVEWPLASKSRGLLPKDDRGPEGRPNDLCIAGTPALLRSREERVPSSIASSCYADGEVVTPDNFWCTARLLRADSNAADGADIHVVFTTSCNQYQRWQAEMIAHTGGRSRPNAPSPCLCAYVARRRAPRH